jgi:hypothetical protein
LAQKSNTISLLKIGQVVHHGPVIYMLYQMHALTFYLQEEKKPKLKSKIGRQRIECEAYEQCVRHCWDA